MTFILFRGIFSDVLAAAGTPVAHKVATEQLAKESTEHLMRYFAQLMYTPHTKHWMLQDLVVFVI
jgi:hypothetical protein